MSKILDTNEKIDMVELHWTGCTGKSFKTVYPRHTAEIFLNKHLIPQREQGLLSNVGITELQTL